MKHLSTHGCERRLLFSALALFFSLTSFTAARAQVVINEIHYNPAGDDATVNLEFLELYNAGPAPVDLSAWKLVFGTDPFVFPIGTTLPSHTYLVVAEKISTLAAATGYTAPFEWQGLNAGLGNGGDDVTLEDATSAIVDFVLYDDAPPWPTAPDGNGPSLELLNPVLDNGLASSWRASVGTNGTPGAQNSTFSDAPTIQSESPRRLSAVETLPGISVTFSTAVTGVAAANLTVNGSPATGVTGTGAGPYVFTGFSEPAPGSATIALASGVIEAAGVPFAGDTWTVSDGIVVVFNEIHYHPDNPNDDAEFLELYNAGAATVDLSGWTISDGVSLSFPTSTTLPSGGFVVAALNPALLQAVTGYAGAIPWTSGRLSNSGERLALADPQGNEIDVVTYSDGGAWSSAADGNGPSLELIHARLPNEFGAAWRASIPMNGTPGATNSDFDPAPSPIIFGTSNTPALPAPSQAVTITATILDESVVPTATLYYRRDQVPTLAYTSTPMLDDGLHGDGAAGDRVYGATVPGLVEGQRLDFTIRASDGVSVSAGPSGNNTLVQGEFPGQTYLCEFTASVPTTDLPHYRLITTQHVRDLQSTIDETQYDSTFLRCTGATCEIFYNILERYRGDGSLFQTPHSFRVNFSDDRPLASEMGFSLTKLNLMSQAVDKQGLGYQFFREAFGKSIPTVSTQFVRFHMNPLGHGGVQNFVYANVEALEGDFLASEHGQIVPTRFPNRCSIALTTCESSTDCPSGETCVSTDTGDLYRGRVSGDLQYLGTDPTPYRPIYDKDTNAEADDWTSLTDQCFVLDPDTTPDASFEAAVNAGADELEWARWFAIHMLLVNQEGGIYRDTGDDYFIYFEPNGSPNGRNAKFLTWDMDSVYGGFQGAFNQDTIWRTTTETTKRFVRNNAYAGRFVGAICDLLQTDFTQAVQNARIDALPPDVADAARKQSLKDWVAARIVNVNSQIVRDFTLNGVPASPYAGASPVLNLSGTLDQCGTYRVLVNGAPATYSVFSATWSASVTLSPGLNSIVVQDLDVAGVELHRKEAQVNYRPPVSFSFQNDASYTGTQDTWLGDDTPGIGNGNRDHVRWDVSGPAVEYTLIRFDNIFGTGPGQIPPGSAISSATLAINVFNTSTGAAGELHEAAVDWSEATTTWNNFGGEPGVQPDEVGAFVAAAPLSGTPASINVTSSLIAWQANPTTNFGWILVPVSTDEARAYSSEATLISNRPKLTVSYLPPCASSGECSDTLFCNGAEVCSVGACLPAAAPACGDGISCTADSCDESNDTCSHVGNDALCDDANACNGVETCGPSGCQAGTPPAFPSEVAGLDVSGSAVTTLAWASQGAGIRYDVATGALSGLVANSGVLAATCLADDVLISSATDTQAAPPAGQGYYYIVRAQTQCGTGTYGFSTGGQERLPAAACP